MRICIFNIITGVFEAAGAEITLPEQLLWKTRPEDIIQAETLVI